MSDDASPTEAPVPERVGPYRIESRLGAGGMGRVYRAWDERLERSLAIKPIRPERAHDPIARARLRREARAAASVNHPAVVQIHDLVETEEGDWIVMELVAGERLDRSLLDGALGLPQALRLAIDIAEGLAAAHLLGLLHRDLKPSNVMVTPAGRAKILDFGLAKRVEPDPRETELSSDQLILGTCHAMSPEQALGRPLDPRSDLFSLGSLLYGMLSGDHPFRTATPTESLTRVCHFDPPPVHEIRPVVQPPLSDLVKRLLSKHPEDRPPDATVVGRELADLAGIWPPSTPATAEPESQTTVAWRVPPEPGGARQPQPMAGRGTLGGAVGSAGSLSGSSSVSTRGRLSSERRQVTVLCFEVGDFGEEGVLRTLDAETVFEIHPRLESLAHDLLERFGGRLEPGPGHRLAVAFGVPRAHEDDARRAVRCALELVAGVERWAATETVAGSMRLAGRAGIHTGPAVMMSADSGSGPIEGSGRVMLGATLEAAQALQSSAPASGVVCSATTFRLVGEAFETTPVAPVGIVGFGDPLASHRVLGPKRDDTWSFETRPRGPMIGRRQELALLLDRWRLVREGWGQALLLSGDAGVGKSRLVAALEEAVAPEAADWWIAAGSPFSHGSPFQPVIDLLRYALHITEDTAPTSQLEALEAILREHALPVEETMPLLAPLLGLETDPERQKPLDLGPTRHGQLTREALVELVSAHTARGPLVLVVEDLHWIDPSTLDWLALLLERISAVPVLLLLTFRAGFSPPWGHSTHATQIHLGALASADVETLIGTTAAGCTIPQGVRRRIVERADGVPLFVEELTKAFLEVETAGAEARESSAVPTTLRASLVARLDRLGPAKEIAQLAAVVGRELAPELLEVLSTLSADQLDEGLQQLTRAGILLRQGFGSSRRYLFKHALLREAAYASLVPRERRQLHGAIAKTLESRFPESVAAHPELLAHHLREAGDGAAASGYWLAASRAADRRSATREAVLHLERSLEGLHDLTEGTERDRRELEILGLLGPALSITRGYSAPEVERTYERALELCDILQIGSDPGQTDSPDAIRQRFGILWGLWSFHLVRSEVERALGLARRLVELADARLDGSHLQMARCALGQAHYFHGDLDSARTALELAAGPDAHIPERGRRSTSITGADTGVVALACFALVLWHLGEEEEAVERSDSALELAVRIDHPYSQVFAHVYAARLHQSRRDPERTRRHAETVITMSRERGYFWLTQGRFFLGCSLAEELSRSRAGQEDPERDEAPLDALHAGLDTFLAAGARLSQTYMLAQLAEHHLATGRPDDAAACLERASAGLEGGERYWEPELLRLHGVLTADYDPSDTASTEAGDRIRNALERARARGDRAFEARARASLANLGRPAE